MIVGFLVLLGLHLHLFAGIGAGLFAVFGFAIAREIRRTPLPQQPSTCGCYGNMLPSRADVPSLVRNVLFMLAAACLAMFGSLYATADLYLGTGLLSIGAMPEISELPAGFLSAALLGPVVLVPSIALAAVTWRLEQTQAPGRL
jgi:hypothetical protein